MLNHLREWHPNLAVATWRISSPYNDSYQCIAWAACRADRHMWPHESYWWFPGCPQIPIPEQAPVQYFVQGFATLGYEPCDSDAFEFGYQKLAIYANELGVTHMARQHFLGRGWLSKLGDCEDIVHQELDDVAGEMSVMAGQYGKVFQVLRRSWWTAVKKGCIFRSILHNIEHWLYRISHPSWNRARRNG